MHYFNDKKDKVLLSNSDYINIFNSPPDVSFNDWQPHDYSIKDKVLISIGLDHYVPSY